MAVELKVKRTKAKEAQPEHNLLASIRRIWRDMPEDVRRNLPADGASQADHYIYGTPKKDA
jgi:hypothetical protein